MLNLIKTLGKWLWDNLWGALISALLAVFFATRIVNWIQGPPSYKIYFVGDFDEPSVKTIWSGFKGEDMHIGNVPMRFKQEELVIGDIPITLEKYHAKESEASSVSRAIFNKKDALLVIGHVTSTATKDALPNYLNIEYSLGVLKTPPMPVILPSESSPNLLPASLEEMAPVFRLAPTDEKLAEAAAKFVLDQNARAIMVIEDGYNNLYSHYLSRSFITQIHSQRAVGKKAGKVLILTSNSDTFADDAKGLGIDWVFFAGTWSNALIAIHQIHETWKNRKPSSPIPNFLLSNSCADSMLIEAGGDDVAGVYLIHSLNAREFGQQGNSVWGERAYLLLKEILSEVDRTGFHNLAAEAWPWHYFNWLFGFHRIEDARNAVRVAMERLRSRKIDLSEGVTYKFDSEGIGVTTPFHIWQIKKVDGKTLTFVDVEK